MHYYTKGDQFADNYHGGQYIMAINLRVNIMTTEIGTVY
jgi:hypothetical protein